ncbi:hypothetical protein [Aliivibrio fischeri]|uniref:hypothetical protein n=1 Tax=Aliivibrio fischeri TaxID=668 RepID=UPI0007C46B98|nr:hypothetical protein [Aliivibrio fischeri]
MTKSLKFQTMRKILVQHVNYSFIEDINIDYYTELALWVLELIDCSPNGVSGINEAHLMERVENKQYLNEMYKQQAIYIATMLINIKFERRSSPSKGITAICDCGGKCLLESNTLNQRNKQRVGLIYHRCTVCGKSASVHKGDMWPNGNFVSSSFRIELLGIHAIINRLCAELNVTKRQLHLKIGNKVRSSESVCHVGLVSPSNISTYRSALLSMSPSH